MAEKHPCEGCIYFGGRWETVKCCNYFLITGKRRPCPVGKDCVVREDGKNTNRRAMTIKKKNAKNTENI